MGFCCVSLGPLEEGEEEEDGDDDVDQRDGMKEDQLLSPPRLWSTIRRRRSRRTGVAEADGL